MQLYFLDKLCEKTSGVFVTTGLILSTALLKSRSTFMAKELMRQGVERTEVARVMKLHYSKQENFLATARRTEAGHLTRILQRLAETDLAIKTSQATPRMQIEMLVSELTG